MLEYRCHCGHSSWRTAGTWSEHLHCACVPCRVGGGVLACPTPVVAVPCICLILDLSHPGQSIAAVSALYFFCTGNQNLSLLAEAKEKCKLLKDEGDWG